MHILFRYPPARRLTNSALFRVSISFYRTICDRMKKILESKIRSLLWRFIPLP